MKSAVDQFHALGVTGMELTGGGEPTLHPDFAKIVDYAVSKGLKVGVCTNGTTIKKWDSSGVWGKLAWIRLGMYGFTEGYTYDMEILKKYNAKVTAAYVWDEAIATSQNPNVTGEWTHTQAKKKANKFQTSDHFYEMLNFVESYQIPTRIAFNAIKDPDIVKQDIEKIRNQINSYEELHGKLKFAFLSDFNYKGERRNANCYMHLVKPFVFTNGCVYVCPSAELSHENNYNYEPHSEFKICDISGITDFYSKPGEVREHACKFCKYAMQNELIDDIVLETEHNEFA